MEMEESKIKNDMDNISWTSPKITVPTAVVAMGVDVAKSRAVLLSKFVLG